jgi:hypothetical protein
LRILFDHNVNRRFRNYLAGHEIQTTHEQGWDTLANGTLLKASADAGFQAFITVDKKLEHEQNLRTLPLPVILIDSPSNALPALIPFGPPILAILNQPMERLLYIVQSGGTVLRLTTPRT